MKRMMAIVLTLVMALSLTTVAWAEETAPAPHNHEGWTALEAFDGSPLQAGSYYLESDCTLSKSITLANNAEVYLCLNGKKLDANRKTAITVNKGQTLHLYDCPGESVYYFTADDTTGLWMLGESETENTVTGGIITNSYSNVAAININGGTVFISGGNIVGNTGTGAGGGIRVIGGGSLTINGGTVKGNQAGNGGGIDIQSSSKVSIDGTVIEGNTATGAGGGIRVSNGDSLTMHGGTVKGNRAGGDGGGIALVTKGFATLTNIIVESNTARAGGGIYTNIANGTEAYDMIVSGGSISNNTAEKDGGGMVVNRDAMKLLVKDNCAISNNVAGGKGGGLFLRAAKETQLENVTITGNRANLSGGLYSYNGCTIKESTIIQNTATDLTTGEIHLRTGKCELSGTLGDVKVEGHSPNESPVEVSIAGTVKSITADFSDKNNLTNGPKITIDAAVEESVVISNTNTTYGGVVEVSIRNTVNGNVIIKGNEKSSVTFTEEAQVSGKVEVSGGNVTNNSDDVTVTVDTITMTNGSAVDSDDDVLYAKRSKGTATLSGANVKQAKTINVTLSDGVEMAFDQAAANRIKELACDNDVLVKVEKLEDASTLTEKQQAQLKDRDVKALYTVTVMAGGKEIFTAGEAAGTLRIAIPYEKTQGKNVKLYCVTQEGKLESVTTAYQDGVLTATLSHLSTYAIVEKNYSTGGGSAADTVQSPETFDAGMAVYAGLALASALGAAYVTGKRH